MCGSIRSCVCEPGKRRGRGCLCICSQMLFANFEWFVASMRLGNAWLCHESNYNLCFIMIVDDVASPWHSMECFV